MIRLRQIKVLVMEDSYDKIKSECASRLGVYNGDILDIIVVKQSIDARLKPNIYYSYVVDVKVNNEDSVLKRLNNNKDVLKVDYQDYCVNISGKNVLNSRPVIVGSGPCGLIVAYMLSKYGYRPIILERGKCVSERVKDVEEFWKYGKLNINSNIQFGEGGAGTFSDGKLNTLVKDKKFRHRKVFEILVENGAPKEIMYESKPHIGTDLLRDVVVNIRKKIIAMGGEFRFNSCLTDINIVDERVKSIVINDSLKLDCQVLILAIGHSARDTFRMLYDKGVYMVGKPFAVGIRIQHPQEMINESQYGVKKHTVLKNASYKLTYKSSKGRGVYTFCMCPGGYVVNASSEEGMVAINGMSNHDRSSGNANSAVVVTVGPGDYGNNPLDGIEFQRKLEKRAYELGEGKIPVSLYGDYVNGKKFKKLGSVNPVFKGNYEFTNIRDIFPDFVNEALVEGINNFGTKIKGYNRDDAVIAAPESRTSSPVRIIRDDNGEANYKGIYPAGEGAGYAGGITSAAMDGLVVFEKIISNFTNEFVDSVK